ncbi:hypothetical protein IB286_04915 [Spongiibacter sp. KMU-158]|uniref:YfaZ n=1 Tax=Spongiibacter pelagi TaxID=2760804 RepID=A0A927BZA7_9GAMM|nr:YfaZ family outer membrane protein [Spongiibacter pelagi]MBD2858343.1 hypothetical protein [Spongiibacter pelagi]
MMKKAIRTSRALALLGVMTAASASHAGGVAFRFGDDSLGFSVAGNLSAETSGQFDWLHRDDDNADMVATGLFANGKRGSLTGRMGVKAVGLIGDNTDYSGAALAFGGDLALPLNDMLRLRGGVFYAPGTTSFSDVDGFREASASLEFNLFQNSAIELGVAQIRFEDQRGRKFEFDDGLFLRLQLRL